MEIVSNVHSNNIVQWAENKPNVYILSGDLTGSTEIKLFKEVYPDRFYTLGMAEQNMVSWAGGMAREGLIPFIHTFAVFLYRRPYDQLAMSVAYPNLKVRLVGFLPGVTTPGGVSHQAIEDIGILRTLPNMTIFEVGDATDVESILDLTDNIDGPIYIRMLRGALPRLFDKTDRLVFNKARVLSEGTDVCIVSSGICTEEVLRASKLLQEAGVSLSHLHVTTLKPFTDPTIAKYINLANKGVITMENHSVIGGLGSAVADVIAEYGLGKKLVKIGLQDTFLHGASQAYLIKKYQLDAMSLVYQVENLLSIKTGIKEEDLQAIRLETKEKDKNIEQMEAL